jgi:hypothetical protein
VYYVMYCPYKDDNKQTIINLTLQYKWALLCDLLPRVVAAPIRLLTASSNQDSCAGQVSSAHYSLQQSSLLQLLDSATTRLCDYGHSCKSKEHSLRLHIYHKIAKYSKTIKSNHYLRLSSIS